MLSLPAELTHQQARACLAQLIAGVGPLVSPIVVDAAPLKRFDSSALAVLLELRRSCLRDGKTLVVHGVPQHLGDLATLYGIEGLLPGS